MADNLTRAEFHTGDLGAVERLRQAASRMRARLKDDDITTLTIEQQLAMLLVQVGRPAEAVRQYETVATWAAKQGPDSRPALITANNLAIAEFDAGDRDRGLARIRAALDTARAKHKADDALMVTLEDTCADLLVEAGKSAEGIRLLEEALAERKTKLGADHRLTRRSAARLASTYERAGLPDRAYPFFFEALERARRPTEPDSLAPASKVSDQAGPASPGAPDREHDEVGSNPFALTGALDLQLPHRIQGVRGPAVQREYLLLPPGSHQCPD